MQNITELIGESGELDRNTIKKIIPYEDPFLMIDKVTELTKKKIIAIKEVKGTEDFFKGHFVDFPIMPGALMIEGMGQAATLLVRYNTPNHEDKDVLAYRITNAIFKAPTFPGMKLTYDINILAQDEKGAMLNAKAIVEDRTVAEAQLMLAVVNKKEFRKKAD